MSDKPLIGDFLATDDSGGLVNLKTGDAFDVGAMLRLFSQDELQQVPLGRRLLLRQDQQSDGHQ